MVVWQSFFYFPHWNFHTFSRSKTPTFDWKYFSCCCCSKLKLWRRKESANNVNLQSLTKKIDFTKHMQIFRILSQIQGRLIYAPEKISHKSNKLLLLKREVVTNWNGRYSLFNCISWKNVWYNPRFFFLSLNSLLAHNLIVWPRFDRLCHYKKHIHDDFFLDSFRIVPRHVTYFTNERNEIDRPLKAFIFGEGGEES